MRRREPRREEIGGLVANFRIGAELPGAVVDVVEIIEDLGPGPEEKRWPEVKEALPDKKVPRTLFREVMRQVYPRPVGRPTLPR